MLPVTKLVWGESFALGNSLREAHDTCPSFPDGELQSWDLRLKPAQCDFLAAYQGQEGVSLEGQGVV